MLRAFRMHKVHGETPPNGEIGVFPVFWFTAVLKRFLLKSSSRGVRCVRYETALACPFASFAPGLEFRSWSEIYLWVGARGSSFCCAAVVREPQASRAWRSEALAAPSSLPPISLWHHRDRVS